VGIFPFLMSCTNLPAATD